MSSSKFNLIDDFDLINVKNFANNFTNKLSVETYSGKNTTANCAMLSEGNFNIFSFGSVLIQACKIQGLNTKIYSGESLLANSGPKGENYFYIETKGNITVIAKDGFSFSPFGLSKYSDDEKFSMLPKSKSFILSYDDEVNIYTSNPNDFVDDRVVLMGDTDVNIFYSYGW